MAREEYFKSINAAQQKQNSLIEYGTSSWTVDHINKLKQKHRLNGNTVSESSHTVQLSSAKFFGEFSPGWTYCLKGYGSFQCIMKLSGNERQTPAFYYGRINNDAPAYYTIEKIKKLLSINFSRKQNNDQSNIQSILKKHTQTFVPPTPKPIISREASSLPEQNEVQDNFAHICFDELMTALQRLKDTYAKYGGNVSHLDVNELTQQFYQLAQDYAASEYKKEEERKRQIEYAALLDKMKSLGISSEEMISYLKSVNS